MMTSVGNTIDPATGERRPMPPEYTELVLCRDVYHCTPAELDEQDWARVQMHIALLNAEAEGREARRKK